MTTHEIRKNIMVNNWVAAANGISINYNKRSVLIDSKWIKQHLYISKAASLRYLMGLGEIDNYVTHPENNTVVTIDGESISWEYFIGKWQFSQYDALMITIKYEENKALEDAMNILEMDSAVAAIKNK
jgi:hypothetical protein